MPVLCLLTHQKKKKLCRRILTTNKSLIYFSSKLGPHDGFFLCHTDHIGTIGVGSFNDRFQLVFYSTTLCH